MKSAQTNFNMIYFYSQKEFRIIFRSSIIGFFNTKQRLKIIKKNYCIFFINILLKKYLIFHFLSHRQELGRRYFVYAAAAFKAGSLAGALRLSSPV